MSVGVSSANRKPPLVCKRNLPKDRSAILTDRGSSAQLAAFASSLFGVGLFMGRVGCGYLLDQLLAPRVAALLFSAVAIRIAFLGLGHGIWSACIAAVLVGLGIAAEVDIIAYLTSGYSGLRPYGAIFGWIWAAKDILPVSHSLGFEIRSNSLDFAISPGNCLGALALTFGLWHSRNQLRNPPPTITRYKKTA
jgi:hypothetical protein